MRIEAELDEIHTERLLRLQRKLKKPMAQLTAEILAKAIDQATEAALYETEGERIYRILEEAGLIGCFEGDGNPSVDDNKHRGWSQS